MPVDLESADTLRASVTMCNTGNHYNMGGKGWQELYRAKEAPRLTLLKGDVSTRGGVFAEWHVDGEPCASLDETVERLRVPAVATPEELAVLRDILTDEPIRLRSEIINHEVRYWLIEKGLIEYTGTPGWFRRSAAGRDALQAASSPEGHTNPTLSPVAKE